jgi:hypothetical protein
MGCSFPRYKMKGVVRGINIKERKKTAPMNRFLLAL